MIFGELDTKKTKPLISTRTPKNSPHYQSLPVEEREVEKKNVRESFDQGVLVSDGAAAVARSFLGSIY